MKKLALIGLTLMGIHSTVAQEVMTPELLWKLGRVTALGISKDGKKCGVQSCHTRYGRQQIYQ